MKLSQGLNARQGHSKPYKIYMKDLQPKPIPFQLKLFHNRSKSVVKVHSAETPIPEYFFHPYILGLLLIASFVSYSFFMDSYILALSFFCQIAHNAKL